MAALELGVKRAAEQGDGEHGVHPDEKRDAYRKQTGRPTRLATRTMLPITERILLLNSFRAMPVYPGFASFSRMYNWIVKKMDEEPIQANETAADSAPKSRRKPRKERIDL